MPFEVFPAVDVFHGRLARLGSEGPVFLDTFGGDPLAAAGAFVAAGARWVHVVDMDRALTGASRNGDLLERMSRSGARVQASGGIVEEHDATEVLRRGAQRAVLSSRALEDRASVQRIVGNLGDAVVVGLEIDGGVIRPRGSETVLALDEALSWLNGIDVRRYLVTDLPRLGGLEGPDIDRIGELGEALARPLLVAGGIASPSDLRGVAAVGSVEGAIVGRVLYEGGIEPGEFFRAVPNRP